MWLSLRTRIIPSLVLVLCNVVAFGQFSVSDYLSQSSSAVEIQAIRAQMEYMEEGKFTSPFLREVELRVRTRDVQSLEPDDYRFRVAPINPFERKANKAHAALLQEQMGTQNLIEFSTVLARRYQLLIRYFYLEEMKHIEEGETQRFAQLIRANSRRVDAGKEIIELDRKLLYNELQREDVLSDLARIEYLIRSGYQFSGQIDLEGFSMVSVSRVKQDLNIASQLESTNIYVLNEENKAKLSESDLEINRQESFSNIGYLQAEYRPYRGETFNETFGIQLAFQLPIVNPDRPDLERRKLDVIKDRSDVEEMRREVNMKLFNFENDLKTMINQYERLENKLSTFGKFSSVGFSNVEALIELEDYRNDLTRKKLDLYHDILSLYVQWLQYKGMLANVPFVNYLSENRESFEVR